ncbi:MAG: TolC family protein [Rhodothermales bacterium]
MSLFLRTLRGLLLLWTLLAVPRLAAQDRAAEPLPLDLATIQAAVRAGNPALEASRLEVDALRARRDQVATMPDPRVMVTYLPAPIYTAVGAQRSQWRIEQAVPYAGTLGLRSDVAMLSADVARHEAEAYGLDLVLEATKAFLTLDRVARMRGVIAAFRDRLTDFEAAAASQYEVGAGSQQAILKLQLERNSLDQRELVLEREWRTAHALLERLTNRSVATEGQPVSGYDGVALPGLPVDSLETLARRLRPEVQALDLAEARAEAQVALARKAALPELGVNVTYFDLAPANRPPGAPGRDALALGVSLSVPLHRDRVRAQETEARLRGDQVRARQEALASAISTQLTDAWHQVRLESEQVALLRDALIPRAETTRQAALSAYATGAAPFLDLLDAERMLFSLDLALEEARYRYLNAHAALERALGVSSLNDTIR